MKFCCAVLFLAFALQGEVVDRVVIAIDRQAITQEQLDEELRVTALLNRAPVVRDRAARRAAADRLIQQVLLQKEMELSRYTAAGDSDPTAYLQQITADLGGTDQFNDELRKDDVSESVLRRHLQSQLTLLKFVSYRFQTDISVTDEKIQEASGQASRDSSSRVAVPPSKREALRQMILEKRTDELLSAWLNDARKRSRIVFLDNSLK